MISKESFWGFGTGLVFVLGRHSTTELITWANLGSVVLASIIMMSFTKLGDKYGK